MKYSKKINITFPVLNEEVQLEESILTTLNFCETHQMDSIELCIADNGSTDQTQEIGEKLAARYTKVSYIRLNEKGVGLALKTAWGQSKADWVGYMDLDLATDIKHLKEVYDLIQSEADYKIILGSRLLKGAKVQNRTLLREIISRCFNFWLWLNLKVSFTDGMCGFKFIEKKLYTQLVEKFEFTNQWFFASELAVRAEWMGAKLLDLPVNWTDDPNSKSSSQIMRLTRQYLQGIEKLKQEKIHLSKL